MSLDTGDRMVDHSMDWRLGGVDARVTMLEKRVAVIEREIKEELRALNKKIDKLDDSIVASRSGWKAIAWFIGVMATIFAAITTLMQLGVLR
ncbi:MAG TPA: hypothetical protein VFP92_00850 [Rhodanobacteraceae bacterium]|nr:hypothetical protein [Rhodanobacteraceae bacterium]